MPDDFWLITYREAIAEGGGFYSTIVLNQHPARWLLQQRRKRPEDGRARDVALVFWSSISHAVYDELREGGL